MTKPRIDRVKLNRMLRSGKSQREAAQAFGVSEAAISKAKKELSVAVVRSTVMENAHKVVAENLDAIGQLTKINQYANELLDLLMRWNRGDQEAHQILEAQAAKKGIQPRDPRELALKAMQEIRGQLGLQLEILKTLYDVQAVAEFQKEVLNAIGEVSPDVRDRIIKRLKEGRALRQSVSIH